MPRQSVSVVDQQAGPAMVAAAPAQAVALAIVQLPQRVDVDAVVPLAVPVAFDP